MPSQKNQPRFASRVSFKEDAGTAAREAASKVSAALGAKADLAVVFASGYKPEDFAAIAEALQQELKAKHLLGCSAESIVCNEREIENSQALTVWAAHLPGTKLTPIELEYDSDEQAILNWPRLSDQWPADSGVILLAEPFSFPTDQLLAWLNEHQPGNRIFGGMASGGQGPGEHRLILDGKVLDTGAVGVLIQGGIKLQSVVSQGCRPIGHPYVVTKAQENVIFELGGRSAVEQLQALYGDLSEDEQAMVREGLHMGQVLNEYQEKFARGDFLVRNVQGFDPEKGAIAIGDRVRVGQTVQFHVRDAETADEDLQALLEGMTESSGSGPKGGLLFTCNGRGSRLFEKPNHDAVAIVEQLGKIPVAGFFAAGEIGPIGQKSFLHGFTASFLLFE